MASWRDVWDTASGAGTRDWGHPPCRPNDYHPDHRYTGILVQDAAYMVTVPFFCPDVAYLEKNPVFLYYSDRFERPNPFRADVVVDIDGVMDKKLIQIYGPEHGGKIQFAEAFELCEYGRQPGAAQLPRLFPGN